MTKNAIIPILTLVFTLSGCASDQAMISPTDTLGPTNIPELYPTSEPTEAPNPTDLPTVTIAPTLAPWTELLSYEALPISSNGLDWSSDGLYIASSGNSNVSFWELSTGNRTTLEEPSGWARSVEWSPDSRILAAVSDDAFLRLWSINPVELVAEIPTADSAYSVSWSPDGLYIAVGAGDFLQIFDFATLKESLLIPTAGTLFSIDWSPDGASIATGTKNGFLDIWDALTGTSMRQMLAESLRDPFIGSIAWSPDSTMIASTHDDGTIVIWDAENGEIIFTLDGRYCWQDCVAWSPDGSLLSASGADGRVRVWELDSLRRIGYLSIPGLPPAGSLAWNPEGTSLAVIYEVQFDTTSTPTLVIWELP